MHVSHRNFKVHITKAAFYYLILWNLGHCITYKAYEGTFEIDDYIYISLATWYYGLLWSDSTSHLPVQPNLYIAWIMDSVSLRPELEFNWWGLCCKRTTSARFCLLFNITIHSWPIHVTPHYWSHSWNPWMSHIKFT